MNIDFTQYNLFKTCPWAWHEKYVAGVSKTYTGPRTDSLALGTLVHAGLEHFDLTGHPTIPDHTILEISPSSETLHLAVTMVVQYAQKVSNRWPTTRCEQTLSVPLSCGHNLVAKVDKYFRVDQLTAIPSGIPEYPIHLTPGVWIEEHKTTGMRRSLMAKRWLIDMQADFQIIALSHHLQEPVNGILINCIEKPRIQPPTRTCKSCKTKQDFSLYLPAPNGEYRCPRCGFLQTFKPVTVTPLNIEFYKCIATRGEERLKQSIKLITEAAEQMEHIAKTGTLSPNYHQCVKDYYICEYFEPHALGRPVALEDGTLFAGFAPQDPLTYLKL